MFYIIYGLPPTPICSPNIEYIEVALNPEETDCLFYLHDNFKKIHCAKTAGKTYFKNLCNPFCFNGSYDLCRRTVDKIILWSTKILFIWELLYSRLVASVKTWSFSHYGFPVYILLLNIILTSFIQFNFKRVFRTRS